MQTHFRQLITACALISASFGSAAAQTVITTEPVETRTVVQAPLQLTPTQRTTIYRTIVPQGRNRAPIVKERVVTETTGSAAAVSRSVSRPVVTRPAVVEYVVGDRVPASVALRPLPETVAMEIPSVKQYRYMEINGRVWLVDPDTSLIVGEVAE
jgi:hypothetical protein